jgi:hypothetical protein
MAWTFVGVSTSVETTATGHTLTLPAGVAQGDLLVAIISSRIASTTSITLPSGWTLVAESKTNNVVAALTTSEASGMMAYCIHGSVAPSLVFTHPTAPSVAVGRIVAYRGGDPTRPFDVGIGAKTATAITAISTTGLTTTAADDLIVKGVCSGRASAFSVHDAATNPATDSGANSVQTAAPIAGTWQERQDASTTTGADTALAIADAIRSTAGATGALTCTATVSGGHAQVAGAFRIDQTVAPSLPSGFAQCGSALHFNVAGGSNTGTVSTAITVPADAELALVCWASFEPTAGYFSSGTVTLTKGGVDTAMTPATSLMDPGVSTVQGMMWHMVLPDTGTNKTLKWDWLGATSQYTPPHLVSITFWKGVDTSSPIRHASAAKGSTSGAINTPTLTAQTGDLIVAFFGGFNDVPGSDGAVVTWNNLTLLTQCPNASNHDGAWAVASPTANTTVGMATETGWGEGGIVAVVIKPAPPSTVVQTGSTLNFTPTTANAGTVSTTITVPADAEMIVVGWASQCNLGPAGYWSGGGMTFTKGGVDTAMICPETASEVLNRGTGVLFYLMNPDTGANKTLKWDWSGTNAAQYIGQCSITFWKGVDAAAPIRDSVSSTATGLTTTGVLNAQAGDRLLAFVGAFTSTEGTVTWSGGLSTITNLTLNNNIDSAWGTGTATGTVASITATGAGWTNTETGIVALAIKPGLPAVTGTLADTEDPDVLAATGTSVQPAVPTQTGSVLQFNPGTGNSGTVSTTITVPSDAELILVGVSGFNGGTANYLSGGSMTFTKGGVDTAMVSAFTNDTAIDRFQSALFYQVLPDTGTNKTLKWDWKGTLAGDDACKISITFWKGIDTASPIRDADGANSASTVVGLSTPSLTAQSGDRIIVWTGFWTGSLAEGAITGWSNCTLISNLTVSASGNADGAWADVVPTGNQTVGITSGTVANDGGIIGIVLKPAAVAGVSGTLADTEDADVAALTGTVRWNAVLTETDDPDVLAATGTVRWQAVLTETDDPDVLAATGTVRWAATLATTEAVDTAAMTGAVAWIATLAAPETADVAALTGTVRWVATLAASETSDVAAFTGNVFTPVTGPLVEIEDPDVGVFTGTVRWAASLATTETVDVLAATGTVSWAATLATTEAPDVAAFTGNVFTQVTGTFGTIEAPDVAAFNGSVGAVGITGTLAAPEPADAAAFTGGIYGTGTFAAPETADVAALMGAISWVATLAVSEAPDVGALTGTVRWAATLTTVETADVGAFLGAVRWVATLAVSETPDVGAFTGATSWIATLAVSEAPDVGALAGTVRWAATLAATEAADVAALTGSVFTPVTGPLSITEAPDLAAFTGGIYATGPFAVTEAADTYAGLGTIFGAGVNVNLAVVEPADGAAFTGQVTGVAGTLGAVEAPDAAALTGAVRWVATLATVEAPDSAALVGTVQRVAILATTEAPDLAAFAVGTRWVATLAVSEAPDVATIAMVAGAQALAGTLNVSEAPDILAFTGTTTNQVVLDVSEAPDDATFIVTFRSFGPLDAIEAPDGMLFVEAPVSIQESPGYILSREQARVRVLANSNERVRLLKYPIPRPRELVNTLDQRIRDLSGRRTRVLVRD